MCFRPAEISMKVCPKCGTKAKPIDKVCSNCGEPLPEGDAPEMGGIPQAQAPTVPGAPAPGAPTAPGAPKPPTA